MKKLTISTLAMLSAITFSGGIQANDYGHSSCDANVNGELSFANNSLEVISNKDETIVFDKLGNVSVNGSKLSLSSAQKASAIAYYDNIESAIPLVVEIGTEAIDITSVALTEVFSELLGADSQLPSVINTKLEHASKAIKDHVYANPNSITFNTTYLKEELEVDNGFEQKLDEIKQEIMASFMGEVFVEIGKVMMSGKGNFSDLESRMESLGDDIEEKVGGLAKQLEKKAQDVCKKFHAIDKAETELHSVKELQELDLITIKNSKA